MHAVSYLAVHESGGAVHLSPWDAPTHLDTRFVGATRCVTLPRLSVAIDEYRARIHCKSSCTPTPRTHFQTAIPTCVTYDGASICYKVLATATAVASISSGELTENGKSHLDRPCWPMLQARSQTAAHFDQTRCALSNGKQLRLN